MGESPLLSLHVLECVCFLSIPRTATLELKLKLHRHCSFLNNFAGRLILGSSAPVVLGSPLQPRTSRTPSWTRCLRAHPALAAGDVREARGRSAGGASLVAAVDGAREHLGGQRPGENKTMVVRKRRKRKVGVTYPGGTRW